MAVLHKDVTGHDANPNITLDLAITDTACEDQDSLSNIMKKEQTWQGSTSKT